MIHLYAVCRRTPAALPAAGVDGSRPVAVEVGDLVAVVSEHERPPEACEASALAHAEVVAAVAESTPTLPVRFGSQHTDRNALHLDLETRGASLADALDEVGDAREVVVRTTLPEQDPAPVRPAPSTGTSTPGRSYMEDRLASETDRRAREEAAGTALAAATATLAARAVRVRDLRGRRGPERSFLVPRETAEAFAAEAREITAGLPGAVTGGPWPPYSFAADETVP